MLVEAAKAAGNVDDLIFFFFEGFTGYKVVKFVKYLFDLVSIVEADVFVICVVQELQNSVGIGAKRRLLGG